MRLSIVDAAVLVGTTDKTLYRLIARGRLAGLVSHDRAGRPRLDDRRLLAWWKRERGGTGERVGGQLQGLQKGLGALLAAQEEIVRVLGCLRDDIARLDAAVRSGAGGPVGLREDGTPIWGSPVPPGATGGL